MRKSLAVIIALLALVQLGYSQKFGYVDTEKIMSKIPDYKAAQDQINSVSQKWQTELEAKFEEIEKMYRAYQETEVLMPKEVREEKQEEIFEAEREAKEYRESKFGYNGELFQLQDSKIQPIQDKVFTAVEGVAKRKRVDMIFDKASGDVTWLYTNAVYDYTDLVLKELGYTDSRDNSGGRDK